MTSADLARWNSEIQSGDPARVAKSAREMATELEQVPNEWVFTLCDKWWQPIGELGVDLIGASGSDPRNDKGSASIKVKGNSEFIEPMMNCRNSLVGVIVETQGLRFPFYIDTHEYTYERGAWTGTANCLAIWDILSYLQIWPTWWLPIQAQPFSHAVFVGPLVTVIENMISECALRIQSGIWEFVNNALSLNLDLRAWFGRLLQSNGNIFEMLKTPMYVVRSNPFLDTSPLVAKTVLMESCATVIRDLTKAYGVDVRVDLWLPGDEQPDRWAHLDQPTYVVTVKDRSQIEGPTKTILDSVLRTVVDLGGSIGGIFKPIIQEVESMPGVYTSPLLGVNFVKPYAIMIAPDDGEDGPITACKVVDHTPKAWQLVIGGKSPKWLNDLINATLSWLVDSIMILIGFTGVPSNLLDGFLNDSFLAFQLLEHYDRRDEMGPYHPGIEQFRATGSSPYNIEALFQFLGFLWDTRGYTSAQATFRNGEVYTLGKEIFRGGLVSIVYWHRQRMFTDYIENIFWRISPTERDVLIQVGDGKAEEAPIAKHQRFITGIFEAINVVTLAPRS